MRAFLIAFLLTMNLLWLGWATPQILERDGPGLEARVAQLEEHDRVTNEQAQAIISCLRNNSYSRTLLGQCIDDWFDAYATVDY